MATKKPAVKKQAVRPVRKTAKPALAKPAAAIVIPPLKKGELWSGVIMTDGKLRYHLIKLPGQADKTNWKGAFDWAKKRGGEVPALRDLALMRTNLRDQFEDKWYWSSEESRHLSDWAWVQDFAYGSQDSFSKDSEFCAVAVRRVFI